VKTALITGITGQDGSYLAELLLTKGYTVHGLVRRASMFNRSRIDHLRSPSGQLGAGSGEQETKRQRSGVSGSELQASSPKLEANGSKLILHYGDLNDLTSVRRLLKKVSPHEVYHLAGQSHVGLSFEIPEVTVQENAMATLGLLEAMRDLDYPVRFYHAASSEVFGTPAAAPQTEATPFNPMNPYGCAKAFATQLCRVYRTAYGLYACSGIAYNHESPRRGENFVTRKITLGAARILASVQATLELGNLEACRDWGYAPEYVEAMWRMLQQEAATDYVLATGQACSIRDFAVAAFAELGLQLQFEGRGADEVARRTDTGAVVVRVDPRYHRLTDATNLVGDASLARRQLGWQPQVVGVALARLMARADAEAFGAGRRRADATG
jgi:GDPmannose 4,6-dehydratase